MEKGYISFACDPVAELIGWIALDSLYQSQLSFGVKTSTYDVSAGTTVIHALCQIKACPSTVGLSSIWTDIDGYVGGISGNYLSWSNDSRCCYADAGAGTAVGSDVVTIGCVCWNNTRSASAKFTFNSCSSLHSHWKSRGTRLSVSRCSAVIRKLPSNEKASGNRERTMWGTYKGAGVIVVCINEEQSARRVARSGLAVPLTPRRQLLALHDPRSAMTLEKALLTVAKARTIVVLFMIETVNSNSESNSMQNSQMQADQFYMTDCRKEETATAPLLEGTPRTFMLT